MYNVLNDNDLCVQFGGEYKDFLSGIKGTSDSGGKCFGASLYWSTEFLREVAGDTNVIGFKVRNTKKFFNFCSHTHKVYANLYDKVSGVNTNKVIVDTLNHQERLLSKKTPYSLEYSLIAPSVMEKTLNVMLSGSPFYKNKCIVLSTILDKPVIKKHNHEGSRYAHATSLINYNGKIFLFDINKGIYQIGTGNNARSLIDLLARTFSIVGDNMNYGLSKYNGGIKIELGNSPSINNGINTNDRYYG